MAAALAVERTSWSWATRLGGALAHRRAERLEDRHQRGRLLRIAEGAACGEGVLCVSYSELERLHGCSECLQDLAQFGLSPDGAVGALAGADDCDSLLAKRVAIERSRDPVESVLERAGDGAVVLGCREEDRIGARDLCFDSATEAGSIAKSSL